MAFVEQRRHDLRRRTVDEARAGEHIEDLLARFNPREEPDALAGTSGSARGALGNQRPYRDRNGR